MLTINSNISFKNLLVILSTTVALVSPIQSMARDADSTDNTTIQTNKTSLSTTTDAERKKPSRVQVTNLANGEVGCHDNVNQVSTPGPCPGTKH